MNVPIETFCKILLTLGLAIVPVGVGSGLAVGATATINPSKDNTLYQYVAVDGDRSNGVGDHFFAGRTDDSLIRRGVIAFDIAANIPAGSTITSVSLSMTMSRTNVNTARTIELRKLLANWGEGTSNANANEGRGATATTNDATWRHRFYSATFWATQGGDFSAIVSASQSVGAVGVYTWSSAQMIADVQSWLNAPATNFGWLVIGNESVDTTAKRFDTRESTSRPVLTIQYTPVMPTPTPTPTPTPAPTPTPTPTPMPFSHPLAIPPVATNANVSISIDEACVSILDGPCTNMWTYGGTYPGLTIRRPTGQTTNVTFTNNLDPAAGEMTVHNHGNHSSPENDGRPNDELISPGVSRTYTYLGIEDGNNERGTVQFYHDHRMNVTARNLWMGLAGLYIIDDPADPTSLPSGAYEVSLAIADRQFDSNNQITYVFDPAGVTGDKILVNGVYQPYLDAADRKYRLHLLNASNTRIYNLTLSSGDAFIQIGTESGLLPGPIARTEMRVGPGERLDAVVDFAARLGQDVYLNDTLSGAQLLKFRVTQHVADDSSIPPALRALPDIGEPTVTRNWNFDRTAGHWTINGLVFDPDRIDARPVLGTTERWIFTNPTGAPHMVHIHDVDQQCLSRNGGACYAYEPMKETWFLGPGETIELKMKFTDHLGKYVLHCHIIEHEDDGMMGQFEVVPPVTPTQVVSRKIHGSSGAYDVDLPLTGTMGIECRSGGAGNNYQVVFTFSEVVTFNNAAVTSGTGSVSGSSGSGTTTVTTDLTGVTNAQRIKVTLFGVSDGIATNDVNVQMGVLVGDSNASGAVNASDVSQTKAQIGKEVDSSTFRSDINASGTLNASDAAQVKAKVGTALP